MEKKASNEIVVLGNKIHTKIEQVDIFSLNYWKENPRVNSAIKQNFGDILISDDQIEELLWKIDSVKDLKFEIEKHGGLIDEILVKGNTVLEGNSRLCAYRHLYKKAKEKSDSEGISRWQYIRARIIPEETSNEIIFSILGTWHIKGKKEWDTYEKAAYLKKMHTDYNYNFKKIAESIGGGSEKFVIDHIKAYDLMVENNVYELPKFSYFLELVKNKKINDYIQKDPQILAKTIKAIKTNKFKKAENIRHLPKVLNDKIAKRDFIDNEVNFEDALETSKNRHPDYEDSFYNQIKKTTNLLEHCSMEKIEEIKSDANKKYFIKQLHKEAAKICKRADID